jgi:lipid-A-disaccharide synthase
VAKRIYFVAGEASGDSHGAALMRALYDAAASMEFCGRGGPKMHAIGGSSMRDWIDEAAVVGLWEVVKRYGFFRRQFATTIAEIEAARPDAVVFIDYPGFNLRLARELRRRALSAKLIYYISPQVWAWNRARIPQMAKWLDLMLCIFPFEAELYNASGLRTIFVGHPMLQNLAGHRLHEPREPNLVGLFPGSRAREVRSIFPVMLATVAEMLRSNAQLRFEIAAASEQLAAEIQQMIRGSAFAHQISVAVGAAPELMQRASVGIVASGTATLEAAYFRLPFVLVYKVSWLTYLAARAVVSVKHLGMPNVLAGREIVREFIQHKAQPRAIGAAALELLNNTAARERLLREFDAIIAKLGETHASDTAARAIAAEINAAAA